MHQLACGSIVILAVLCRGTDSKAPIGSSSSGSDQSTFTSLCNTRSYFCPQTAGCYPRKGRCNGIQCEIGCFRNTDDQSFFDILIRYEHLPGFWGGIVSKLDDWIFDDEERRRRRRRVKRFKHVFVRYRGFIYEYGQDYPAREIDPLDPGGRYAYLERPNDIDSYRRIGTSSCNRRHVQQFNDWWNQMFKEYHVTAINCQEYANLLGKYLMTNCTGMAGSDSYAIPQDYFNKLFHREKLYTPCDDQRNWGWTYCIRHIWSHLVVPNVRPSWLRS